MPETQTVTLGTVEVEQREADRGSGAPSTDDQREVVGMAVPYGVTVDLGNGVRERFSPGAFAGTKPGATVRTYGHGAAIGKIVEVNETTAGLMYRAKLSRTVAGEEAWTLVRDGVLHSASVGFASDSDGSYVDQDGTVVRTRARLLHLSLTGEPAYATAKVLAHREATTDDGGHSAPDAIEGDTMPADLAELSTEVAELRTSNEDFQRALDAIRVNTTPAAPAPGIQYRSGGAYMKAIASGEENALKLHQRDFITSTDVATADRPAFLADAIRLVDQGRPTWNAFSSAPLPSSGNSVEFLQLAGNTMAVGVQAAEGDLLTYGEISFVNRTAPVRTLGGWTSLSRQVVERSPLNVLDVAYTAMNISYSTACNSLVSAVLTAGTGFSTATLATADVAGWTGVVIDAVTTLGTSGIRLPAETMIVSSNVFKALALTLDGDDRPVLNLTGPGVNNIGTLSVMGLSGSIVGLPVICDPTLPTDSAYVVNREAIRTLESGGPNRLTDTDITHLVDQVSIYGYVAVTIPFPSSIVKVNVAVLP